MIAAVLTRAAPYKLIIEIIAGVLLFMFAADKYHQYLEHQRGIGRAEVQAKWEEQKKRDAEAKAAQDKVDREAKAAREEEFAKQLAQATKNGAEREQTIRTLAGAAGASGVGLRDAVTAAVERSVSSVSGNAVRDVTRALGASLTECEGRRRAVAEDFERANSDKRTLMEAWPRKKNPTTPPTQGDPP